MTVNTDSFDKIDFDRIEYSFTMEMKPLSYTTSFNFDNHKITEIFAFAPPQYIIDISDYYGVNAFDFSKTVFYLKAADDITQAAINDGYLILPEENIKTPDIAMGTLQFGNIRVSGKAPGELHLEIGLYEYKYSDA